MGSKGGAVDGTGLGLFCLPHLFTSAYLFQFVIVLLKCMFTLLLKRTHSNSSNLLSFLCITNPAKLFQDVTISYNKIMKLCYYNSAVL